MINEFEITIFSFAAREEVWKKIERFGDKRIRNQKKINESKKVGL
jgi:hypothetical protein